MAQISKLVRQRLAKPVATAETQAHPDADLLTGFLEQSLSASERHSVLQHLAFCTDCRDLAAVAMPEERAVQPVTAPVPQAAGWRRLVLVRWGSAAAMLVIAVGAVMLYRGQDVGQQTRQVAEVRAPQAVHEPAAAIARDVTAPAKESDNTAGSTSVAAESRSETKSQSETKSKTPTIAVARKEGTSTVDGASGAGNAGGIASGSMAKASAPALQPAPPVEVNGILASTVSSSSGFAPSQSQLRFGRVLPAAPANDHAAASDNDRAANPAETVVADAAPKDAAPGAALGGLNAQKTSHRVFNGPFSINGQRTLGKTAMFSGESKAAAASSHAGTHWKVSELGGVQHSADGGATWTPVLVSAGVTFRTVGHNGSQVWAGGDGGALFHSGDDGATWTHVTVTTLERTLKGDIITIDAPTAQSVTLWTSADETWTTFDSGLHWDVR